MTNDNQISQPRHSTEHDINTDTENKVPIPEKPPKASWKRYLRLGLGLLIAGLIFYFIFKRLVGSWQQVGETLLTGDPLYLALSFGLLFLCFPLPILVWRRIVFDLYGHKIDLKFSFVAIMLANASRYIPGKVWFIGIMAWMAHEYKVSKERFVVASILTQLFNLVGAAIIGVALTRGGQVEIPIWTLAIVGAGLIFVLQPKFLHKAVIWALRLKHTSVEVPTMKFDTVAYSIALQGLALGLMGASMFLMAKAFSPELTIRGLPQTMGSFSMSYLLGYLSFFVPAGVGVREGSLMLLLPANMTEAVRATVSIGFRIWSIVVELIHTVIALIFYAKIFKESK